METFWTVGIVVLGIGNVLCLLLLLAFARELGVILVRLGPSTARATVDGPTIGEVLEPIVLTDLHGGVHGIAATKTQQTLLVFMAPSCSSCRDLIPGLRTMKRQYAGVVRIYAVGSQPHSRDREFAAALDPVPFALDEQLAVALKIHSTPYAILLDSTNAPVAKGLVNNLEHLESLVALQVHELDHASAAQPEPALSGGD
jgi:methylamine dehydrogenase accessory protein MauD